MWNKTKGKAGVKKSMESQSKYTGLFLITDFHEMHCVSIYVLERIERNKRDLCYLVWVDWPKAEIYTQAPYNNNISLIYYYYYFLIYIYFFNIFRSYDFLFRFFITNFPSVFSKFVVTFSVLYIAIYLMIR